MGTRDESPWLIALAVVALLVGAAGVYLGLDARAGSHSDKELAEKIRAQVSASVPALRAENEAQLKSAAASQKQLATTLKAQIKRLQKQVAALNKKVSSQATTQKQLQTDIQELQRQVKALQQK